MQKNNWPPIVIALVLSTEIAAVYTVERWVLRQGKSPAAVHASRHIEQEVDLRFQQGVAMLHVKQYDHAMTAFHRVLQLSPQLPEAHVNMGFVLLGTGKYKEALDFFDGALVLRSTQINAHYGAALAQKALGNSEEASAEMHNYLMQAHQDDPYRAKAEEALKRWQAELKEAELAKEAERRKEKKKSTPARRHDGH